MKYILVDGNAVGYFHQQSGVVLRSGSLQTQAAFGFLKDLRLLRTQYPDAKILVLWDGRAQWRFDLHPAYKSNRNSDPKRVAVKEAYKQQRPYIDRMISSLGIAQVTGLKHEADDLAGFFTATLTALGHEIILFTGDHDWMQLVKPGVTWRDVRDKSNYVSVTNFLDKTGYRNPMAFLEGKCLQGDTSDVIPGVGRIGEDTAPLLLAEHGSILNFWRGVEAGTITPKNAAERRLCGMSPYTKDEWEALFEPTGDEKADKRALKKHMDAWPGQGKRLFLRNFQLMQLMKVAPPHPDDLIRPPAKFDEDAFVEVCAELSFMSVINNLETFIGPFRA